MSMQISRPALQPSQRRTARNVSRASSSPDSTIRSMPDSSLTRSSTSALLAASRTADVANARISSQPSSLACRRAPIAAPTRASAPSSARSPRLSMCSARRSTLLRESCGVGCAPGCASTTSRWTVFEPTSNTPSRIVPRVSDLSYSSGRDQRGGARLPPRMDRVRRPRRPRTPDSRRCRRGCARRTRASSDGAVTASSKDGRRTGAAAMARSTPTAPTRSAPASSPPS